MFDLLPENTFSRKAVRWGIALSFAFIALGLFGVFRGHYEEGTINAALGIAMLQVWSTRKREPSQKTK